MQDENQNGQLVSSVALPVLTVLGSTAAAMGITYLTIGQTFASLAEAYQSTGIMLINGGATVLGVIGGAAVGAAAVYVPTKISSSIGRSIPSDFARNTATTIAVIAGACLGPNISHYYLLGSGEKSEQQGMAPVRQIEYAVTQAGNYKLVPQASTASLPRLSEVAPSFETVAKIGALVAGRVSDDSVKQMISQQAQRTRLAA